MKMRRVVLVLVSIVILAACGDDDGDCAAKQPEIEAPALMTVLPRDTRGVLAVDFASLLSGEPLATAIASLLEGQGVDAALNFPFETIRRYTLGADIAARIESVVLAQTTDANGFILVAETEACEVGEVVETDRLHPAASYKGHSLYREGDSDLHVTLLRDGRLVVGRENGVHAAIDTYEAEDPGVEAGDIGPYLVALDESEPFAFVYGLPALYREVSQPGSGAVSLRGARAVSGALSFSANSFQGRVSFHTDNAANYVDRFNELVSDTEIPLLIIGDSGTVDVEIPTVAFDRAAEEILESRALLKKLVHGMDAVDYADGVVHGGSVPWLNFDVGGEPNSIFINFEFADRATIRDFEANELPMGFKLAPIRILETDEPTYFLVLNAYQSSGGLVDGARVEWSVFVEDPEGGHPRFLVVQAAAENVSADSVNLLTLPEPVSHEFDGGRIVSYVGVEDPNSDEVVDYFVSRIVWPQEPEDRVGFAREFVAANDYIYWGNGVSDRTLYNASIHNRDGVRIPDSDVEISDDSPWGKYVKPRPKHSYVYLNPLEIVISPWWNLDAEYLDVTADFRQELIRFKNNFYPTAVRQVAESAVAGEGDALAAFTIGKSVPSVYFNFVVTDPGGFESTLSLPEGTRLAKIQILESEAAADYYLSLRVYEVDDAPEGRRAEWTVYVEEDEGRAHALVLDQLTAGAAADPVRLLQLASVVEHAVADGQLRTTLDSDLCHFDASIQLAAGLSAVATLDWVESGDWVCRMNGACDKIFYDGRTMEEPLLLVARDAVEISRRSTPWDEYLSVDPASVLVRESVRSYAWNPWRNVSR